MYLPEHFRENDPDRLAGLIEAYSFATLVSVIEGAPFASHLPLLYDRSTGPQGTLYGHLARANPQAAALAAGEEALAIFQGPHAYVSSSWYSAPLVPTWNYAVVHVRGRARILSDEQAIESLLEQLVAQFDPPVADPDGPVMTAEQKRRMHAGIVVFAIEVTSLQGKFKLSQNRSIEDRQRVIARLGQDESPEAQAVAGLMLEDLVRR